MRSASVRHAGGYLCSEIHGLHFHGSFNTFPEPLFGIYQRRQWQLAVILIQHGIYAIKVAKLLCNQIIIQTAQCVSVSTVGKSLF